MLLQPKKEHIAITWSAHIISIFVQVANVYLPCSVHLIIEKSNQIARGGADWYLDFQLMFYFCRIALG